jgi:hypothetical protein
MVSALEAEGIHVLPLDLTDETSIKTGVDTILAREGRIDILVNNAGYGSYGAVEDVTIAEARRQFEVNIFGLARLTQLVLPKMRENRFGKIVNITSIGGKIYTPFGAWYHATKHALEGWSDVLRIETALIGIDVIIVDRDGLEPVVSHRRDGFRFPCALALFNRTPREPMRALSPRCLAGGASSVGWFSEQTIGNNSLLNFRSSFEDLGEAGVAPVALDRVKRRVSSASQNL